MAVCAILAALGVVLMLLGGVLELGMYACPLFTGLCFLPVGMKYGRKYHIMVYVATAVLCFLLVPSPEENLLFAGLLGWYPIARPILQKLPKLLRGVCKGLLFNSVVIGIEWLVMTVLAPEAMETVFLWILLILGNITFFAYDYLIPRVEGLAARVIKLL